MTTSRRAALLLSGVLVAVGVSAPTAAAAAATAGPGECTDDSGVTVVVDFSDLGGDIVVRCVRGPDAMTGLETLRTAGFTVEGTVRWGNAFVCRIQGRPGPRETLEFDDEQYQEQCHNTPPAQAYWGYWYAADGGQWRFSSQGASTRQVSEGGFEGWAFSLDENSGRRKPAYEPDRPDGTTPSASPTTPSPDPDSPREGGNAGQGGGKASQPKPKPRPENDGPTATTPPSSTPPSSTPPSSTPPSRSPSATATPRDRDRRDDDRRARGQESDRRKPEDRPSRPSREPVLDGADSDADVIVTGDVPDTDLAAADDTTPTGTLVGAGLLLGLTALGGAMAWRRRHQQR